MNLNQIRDFIEFVSTRAAFDAEVDINFDVDRTGTVDRTHINVHLTPYADDFDPDDEIGLSAGEPEVDSTDAIHEIMNRFMQHNGQIPGKKKCYKEPPCAQKECTCKKDPCAAEDPEEPECKTEIHRFPGGFCLHTVSKKKETPPEPEIDQEKLMEEIMADLPEMFAKLRERYGD